MTPPAPKAIRVLIVEDSQVVAEFLTHLLGSDPRLQVVGVATDGEEAVEIVQQVKPDVVTMDIHLPKMDGFQATRRIMESCPTPVVIVSGSASSDEVATNFHAIDAGALAVIRRPSGFDDSNHDSTVKELLETVRLMAEVKVVRRWPRRRIISAPPTVPAAVAKSLPGKVQVVAIGASTGGPIVLQTILSRLPKNFPLPILIVQHMAAGFVHGFTEWLTHSSGFPVQVAVENEFILPGRAYVGPDDVHLGVRPGNRILLQHGEKENGMRPAVSFLFRSVEEVFGSEVIAVILTGMGADGVPELKRLKDAGAMTIAQDKESSIVHGMPGQAILSGAATRVLSPEGITMALASIVHQR